VTDPSCKPACILIRFNQRGLRINPRSSVFVFLLVASNLRSFYLLEYFIFPSAVLLIPLDLSSILISIGL